ncbi:energy-coupling factor ABC transporter ATP-binding protein [Enemella evansiae]|uniref:energy-coupling factor ABC transporter ATP-binding protein n=1 Tax=Enemella evansiae TaxID=2016499 RepID=UPI000C00EDA4|nr:biotin transport system ATP-binding protein [Propionibacteriaceae bacterium ES.041]
MSLLRLTGAGVRVEGDSGPKTLLHPCDLTLTEQRIAVIGANGSGKSTLLRLFNGLIAPTTGTVTVDGLDTVRQGRAVRRRVGFVFTDPLAQLVMSTPIEDIELSLRRTHRRRADREQAALQRLRDRGLESLARQSIYDLSGGERQLVALTSVLATEPEIIVADEPTTLLDLRHRRLLAEAFAALDQQLVLATHDLDLAAEMERVLVVDRARICFDGAPTEAIAHYRELMA